MSTHNDLRQLSRLLFWRGGAMVAFAVAAMGWPDTLLTPAMLGVGAVATFLGIYEAALAIALRKRASAWWLVLAHAITSLTFGLITLAASELSPSLAVVITVVVAWFLFYASVTASAAVAVGRMNALRGALAGWACCNIALATLALISPLATVVAFVFFGVVYATLLGIGEMAVSAWLVRSLPARDGSASPRAMRLPDAALAPSYSNRKGDHFS